MLIVRDGISSRSPTFTPFRSTLIVDPGVASTWRVAVAHRTHWGNKVRVRPRAVRTRQRLINLASKIMLSICSRFEYANHRANQSRQNALKCCEALATSDLADIHRL